jgi:predicted aspartyl protease
LIDTMVYGYFREGIDLPYIEVSIIYGKKVILQPAILDTGFSGGLKITQKTANELGIVGLESGRIITPYGESMAVHHVDCFVELERRRILLKVLIFSGPALVGIGLLDAFGYKAVVDPRNRKAHLEKV